MMADKKYVYVLEEAVGRGTPHRHYEVVAPFSTLRAAMTRLQIDDMDTEYSWRLIHNVTGRSEWEWIAKTDRDEYRITEMELDVKG